MSGAGDLLTLARVAGSLVVVLVVAALVARMARRATGGRGSGLTVLHRQGLSRDASVSVVQLGEKVLVLGVTASQVSLLSELDGDAAQALAPAAPTGRSGRAQEISTAPSMISGPTGRPVQAQGSVLSPRTWRQGLDAVRDLTVRRG